MKQQADWEGLQVVPNQGDVQGVPDKTGLEVAVLERHSSIRGGYLHKAYGREEKIPDWSIEPSQKEWITPIDCRQPPQNWRKRNPLLFKFSIALALCIVIGAGVAGGVSHEHHPSGTPTSTNAPSTTSSIPTMTSRAGSASASSAQVLPRSALTNTGIVALYPATEADQVWLYWQDQSLDIRMMTLSYQGTWQNSASLGINNALNGSAMAATAYYVQNQVTNWMFTYVDKNGILQSLVSSTANTTWANGSLGSFSFKAATDRRIGMGLCAQKNLFAQEADDGGGMILMAGGTDGLVHEYPYSYSNDSWVAGNVFEGTDGYAAATPEVVNNDYTSYLYTVTNSFQPELQIWWRDTGNATGWQNGTWNKGPDSIGSVQAGTALNGASLPAVYYLDGSSKLASMNMTGDEDHRRWGTQMSSSITAIPGSMLGSAYVSDQASVDANSGPPVHIFLQTNSTNLIHTQGVPGNMTVVGDVPIFA